MPRECCPTIHYMRSRTKGISSEEIKSLYESNFDTLPFTDYYKDLISMNVIQPDNTSMVLNNINPTSNIDMNILSNIENHITITENINLNDWNDNIKYIQYDNINDELFTTVDIRYKTTTELGETHIIGSNGNQLNMNIKTNDDNLIKYTTWAGIKDQSIIPNQDASGLILPTIQLFDKDLMEVENGLPSADNVLFDLLTTASLDNISVFGLSFITKININTSQYIHIEIVNTVTTNIVYEESYTNLNYNINSYVELFMKINLNIFAGEIYNIKIYYSNFIDDIKTFINATAININEPYVKLFIRNFANIPLDKYSSLYYQISMNFLVDNTNTTIILNDIDTGNDITNYPRNTLNAIDTGNNTIRIQQLNGIIIYINELELDKIYINGILVTQTIFIAINELNAFFIGASNGINPPVLTSSSTLNLIEGFNINYELTMINGTNVIWNNLPNGLTILNNNPRILIGGSNLSIGNYVFNVILLNSGFNTPVTMNLNVTNISNINTLSTYFPNNTRVQIKAKTSNPFYRLNQDESKPWTMSLWFKAGNNTNQTQTIYSFITKRNEDRGLVCNYNGSGKYIYFRYGDPNNNLTFKTQNNTILPNTWQHIMITYDGDTTYNNQNGLALSWSRFKFFINSIEQVTINDHVNYGFSGEVGIKFFRLGRTGNERPNRSTSLKRCYIDEVVLWSENLSNQVNSIYNAGIPLYYGDFIPNPYGYWRMGDNSTYPFINDEMGITNARMINMTPANFVTDIP